MVRRGTVIRKGQESGESVQVQVFGPSWNWVKVGLRSRKVSGQVTGAIACRVHCLCRYLQHLIGMEPDCRQGWLQGRWGPEIGKGASMFNCPASTVLSASAAITKHPTSPKCNLNSTSKPTCHAKPGTLMRLHLDQYSITNRLLSLDEILDVVHHIPPVLNPVHAHSSPSRLAHNGPKPVLGPHLAHPAIPLLLGQHAQPLEPRQHLGVVHVKHGSCNGARVDGHMRPRHEEAPDNHHPHQKQRCHRQPHAGLVRRVCLRDLERHVAEQNRHKLGHNRREADDGEKVLSALDGAPDAHARDSVRWRRQQQRSLGRLRALC